jgi:hypothetical protein
MLVADSTFDITNIDKSYAVIDITVPIKAVNMGTIVDPDHLLKGCLCFKSSNQAFRELEITSNNKTTNYKVNNLQLEGFAYSRNKCEAELQRKRGVHTSWDSVFKYMPNICGGYFNIADLSNGNTVYVKFQILVPFTNLLCLSFFSYEGKFPSFIANIIFKDVLLSHGSLCWGMCSPEEVRVNKAFLQGDTILGTYGPLAEIDFEHRFAQVNDPLRIPNLSAGTGTAMDPLTYTSGKVHLMVSTMRITQWQSFIKGYMIKDSAKTHIAKGIEQLGGLVFPSQEIHDYRLNNPPNAKGLSSETNISLCNTNSICTLFPTTSNQITCFPNPCLVGVQMKIGNDFVPTDKFDTTGIIHLQDQLAQSSLDGVLSPSKDYENGIILEHNKPFQEDGSGGERYTNSLADDTSYLCQFQTERSDGAFVIDGLNTNGQNIPIKIEGVPKYPGLLDTYYIPDPDHPEAKNNNTPILIEVRDTFSVLDLNGLHYKSDEVPRGSQVE